MAEGRLNKCFRITCLTRDVTYLRIWVPCRHQVRPAFWVVLASPLGALWTAPSYRGFFALGTVAQASVGDFFLLTEFPCGYQWSFNTRESCNQKQYSKLQLFSTVAVCVNAESSWEFTLPVFFFFVWRRRGKEAHVHCNLCFPWYSKCECEMNILHTAFDIVFILLTGCSRSSWLKSHA